jgi:hypothetical protein
VVSINDAGGGGCGGPAEVRDARDRPGRREPSDLPLDLDARDNGRRAVLQSGARSCGPICSSCLVDDGHPSAAREIIDPIIFIEFE